METVKLAISTWDSEEFEAIDKVIKSNNFTMGERVALFEQRFSSYIGTKYSVMVNSGSSANLLMIASLILSGRLRAGDEVIVPAVSWSTTYSPLQQYGLKAKFVDINLETLNIDLTKIRSAITSSTKAIFVVNLLGNPAHLDEIKNICKEKDLIMLEDNCESLGAELNQKKAGSFGLMGTHSFFFSHHISTMEGGMISTDDEIIFEILKSIRAHGWTRNLSNKNILSEKSSDEFYEMFNFILPGYNLRPLEMSGAIGVEQLKKLDNFVKIRQINAQHFKEILLDKNWILTQKENGSSSWFGFSLINKSELSAIEFRTKVKSLGFEIRPIVTGNFVRNEVIKFFDYDVHENLANADYLHENGLFIGNNSIDIRKNLDNLTKL